MLLGETIRNIFYYEVGNSDNLDGQWQLKFVSVLETNNKRHWGTLDVGQRELSWKGGLLFVKWARTDSGQSVIVCGDAQDSPVWHVWWDLSTGAMCAEVGVGG